MRFYCEVFRMHFMVIKARTLEEAFSLANLEPVESGDFMARTVHSWTRVKGQKVDCIFLMFNPDYNIDSGTVAHEALHAVNFMLKARGVEVDTTNDEVQAYFLEWVVDKTIKILTK